MTRALCAPALCTPALRGRLARCLLAVLICAPAAALASPPANTQAGAATVRFTFVDNELEPARYSITVHEDGSGHYRSERGTARDDSRFPAQPQNRSIRVSSPVLNEIFSIARSRKHFGIRCDSGGKRVAFQGTKTLEYSGPDGHGSCTYNWSKDKQIEKLTSIFEGISFTLIEGARLKLEDTYFKLQLDPEMQALVEAAREGNALEIENIDPILETIAGDSRNLDRVRSQASKLLSETSSRAESRESGN